MVMMDFTDTKHEDDLRGSSRPKPGRYHVAVSDVDVKALESEQKFNVTFDVLNGTVPGQAGRQVREFFTLSEKALPRVKLFVVAAGLVKPGTKGNVDFRDAVGRQLVIEVDERKNENDGKTYINCTFSGFWSLDHDDAKDVPKDADAIKLHRQGKAIATAAQAESGGSGGDSGGGSADDFSDL